MQLVNYTEFSSKGDGLLQKFLDKHATDIQTVYELFKYLDKTILTNCRMETNTAIVKLVHNSALILNLNIQGMLVYYSQKKNSLSQISMPKQLALNFPSSIGEDGFIKMISTILPIPLQEEELKFIFIIIHNEKINFLFRLQSLLKDKEIPRAISILDLPASVNNGPVKKYSPQIIPQVAPLTNSILDNMDIHINKRGYFAPNNLGIPFFPNPNRSKRSWWSQGWAGLTGLAEQDSVAKLSDTQLQIKIETEREAKEINVLNDKSNEILTSIKKQGEKLVTLYSDEISLKQSLQTLLNDEGTLVNKIAHLAAAMETLSDISLEYANFASTLNLVLVIIRDLEHSVIAVLSQDLHPELLPAEDLHLKIPIFTRAALLSGEINLELTPM